MNQRAAVETCNICGNLSEFTIHRDATLLRDAKCTCCKSPLRSSDVAGRILHTFKDVSKLRILNTCSTGAIYNKFHLFPNYIASEFFDNVPNGQKKGDIYCVDLMKIPFEDESFDLVVSEDVFEHIKDYKKAFKEVHRVLCDGGYHIFTVPVHEGKKTKSRLSKPNIVHHGDPLRKQGVAVCTDFGDDLPELLNEFGFETEMYTAHEFYSADQITDVDATYKEYLKKRNRMNEYFKYNSIVFISKKR